MAADILRIPRDPTADNRTRAALDIISAMLNGLLNSGTITQVDNTWVINTTTDDNILANQIFGA